MELCAGDQRVCADTEADITSIKTAKDRLFKAFRNKVLGVMLHKTSKRGKARFFPVKP